MNNLHNYRLALLFFLVILSIVIPFKNAHAGGVFDVFGSIFNIVINAPLAIAEYTIGKTVGAII